MRPNALLPRLLVIDDLFGRTHTDRRNEERANLCAQYLLDDVTGDEVATDRGQTIRKPIAQAVFFRGQTPKCATVGDVVVNDLEGSLRVIADGAISSQDDKSGWSMILLDLCFHTGPVTSGSNQQCRGMPEGSPRDNDPQHYFGLQILRAIHAQFPDLPVIILSSMSRGAVNRQFSQYGALGFLDRARIDAPDLLKEYVWRHGLIPDNAGQIVGGSRPLLMALRAARRAAKDRRNVLLRGPRGSGKELFAHFIHRSSDNPDSPLAIVDSGTLSAQLYASELFGHKRGAFTGADRDRVGRIVEANGGDLFLDEIGNMPMEVQMGLLRAIEYRTVTPIGSVKGVPVDLRFISATNEDIERVDANYAFRLDLLDRLREFGTITLPSLAERWEDIPSLIRFYVRQAEASVPGALQRAIDPAVFEKALHYSWPGNVRELKNCIFSAVSRNPDVEFLFPLHLAIQSKTVTPVNTMPAIPEAVKAATDPLSKLRQLLADLEDFNFEELKRDELEGLMPALDTASSSSLCHYLRAVIAATTKPITRQVQIHPAIKMAMGDSTVSASKAAGIVKQILKRARFHGDPLLHEANVVATRLRPAGRKSDSAERQHKGKSPTGGNQGQ